jgi:hypothetical protein
METKKYRIFRKAYNALKDCTPINSDCGILCNKACCKGGDEKGMLLFPGEEEFLENNKYLNIRKTNIVFNNGYKVCFATCSGKCDRSQRPLSCMIFPLTLLYVMAGFIWRLTCGVSKHAHLLMNL